MRESEVERYLKKQVEANGGKCWKWVSPGRIGVPDRIVIMPGGVIVFVELKAPGNKERESQVRVQQILRDLGCVVYSSVDSKAKVDAMMLELLYVVRFGEKAEMFSDKNVVQMIFEHMNKREVMPDDVQTP